MRSETSPEATGQWEAAGSGLCIAVATPWGVVCLGDKSQGEEVWLTAEDSGLDWTESPTAPSGAWRVCVPLSGPIGSEAEP